MTSVALAVGDEAGRLATKEAAAHTKAGLTRTAGATARRAVAAAATAGGFTVVVPPVGERPLAAMATATGAAAETAEQAA